MKNWDSKEAGFPGSTLCDSAGCPSTVTFNTHTHPNTLYLLQGIYSTGQHVEVVQRRNGGGQVALGVIQLLNVTCDFFNLFSFVFKKRHTHKRWIEKSSRKRRYA